MLKGHPEVKALDIISKCHAATPAAAPVEINQIRVLVHTPLNPNILRSTEYTLKVAWRKRTWPHKCPSYRLLVGACRSGSTVRFMAPPSPTNKHRVGPQPGEVPKWLIASAYALWGFSYACSKQKSMSVTPYEWMVVEAERRDETARIEETNEEKSRGPGFVWSAGCPPRRRSWPGWKRPLWITGARKTLLFIKMVRVPTGMCRPTSEGQPDRGMPRWPPRSFPGPASPEKCTPTLFPRLQISPTSSGDQLFPRHTFSVTVWSTTTSICQLIQSTRC